MDIHLVEIQDISDNLLLPWLDLYESAFPPYEKIPVSNFLKALKGVKDREDREPHLLAAVNEKSEFVGMAYYEGISHLSVGYLVYFAVDPSKRNNGIGGKIYQEILELIQNENLNCLVFEVEDPQETEFPEGKSLAARRILFYKRQGAKLLTGVRYLQYGPDVPDIPMHLMFHSSQKIDGEIAFSLGESLFGESLIRLGEIGLE